MSRSEHRDRWDRRSVGSIAFLTLVPMLIAILAPIAQAAKPGALDRSFGHNGKVTTNFGHYNTALAAAIDGHGRIVAAGSDFDLARYRRNGELDHTFSDDGKVTGGGYDDALAVAIDSHGRIVVAGSSEECNFSSPYSSFVLARYKSNGSPDPSFDPATTTFTGYRVPPPIQLRSTPTGGSWSPEAWVVECCPIAAISRWLATGPMAASTPRSEATAR